MPGEIQFRVAGYEFATRGWEFVITDSLPGKGFGDGISFLNSASDGMEPTPGIVFFSDDSEIGFFDPSGTALHGTDDIDLSLFPENRFILGLGFLGNTDGSISGDFVIGAANSRFHRVGSPNGVPDAGSTLLMLGLASGGLVFLKMKRGLLAIVPLLLALAPTYAITLTVHHWKIVEESHDEGLGFNVNTLLTEEIHKVISRQ